MAFSEKLNFNDSDKDYLKLKTIWLKWGKKLRQKVFATMVVYDWNHYFGLVPLPKPKPKLADTFSQYCKWYWNYILKGESSYQ